MRWHDDDDDGRAEVRGPGESDPEAVAIVGFELADLHLLQGALRAALQRLGLPPVGVGGIDRPLTEYDQLERLLGMVEQAMSEPPVATDQAV
jgi:hypothetical protein